MRRSKAQCTAIEEDSILSQETDGQLGYFIEVSVWNPSRHGPRPWERIGQEIIEGTYRSGWWVEANGITHWNEQPPKKHLEKHKERIISMKGTSAALEQPNLDASAASWPHQVAHESRHPETGQEEAETTNQLVESQRAASGQEDAAESVQRRSSSADGIREDPPAKKARTKPISQMRVVDKEKKTGHKRTQAETTNRAVPSPARAALGQEAATATVKRRRNSSKMAVKDNGANSTECDQEDQLKPKQRATRRSKSQIERDQEDKKNKREHGGGKTDMAKRQKKPQNDVAPPGRDLKQFMRVKPAGDSCTALVAHETLASNEETVSMEREVRELPDVARASNEDTDCFFTKLTSPAGNVTYSFDVQVLNGGPRVKVEPDPAAEAAMPAHGTRDTSNGEDAD